MAEISLLAEVLFLVFADGSGSGKEPCVTTLITAAKETTASREGRVFSLVLKSNLTREFLFRKFKIVRSSKILIARDCRVLSIRDFCAYAMLKRASRDNLRKLEY